jgi:hypothetical protein
LEGVETSQEVWRRGGCVMPEAPRRPGLAIVGAMIPATLLAAQLVPVPPGEKAPWCRGWPDLRLSHDELQQHLARDGNVAMRDGRASGDLVDVDLDCAEALVLADTYLHPTRAEFGRASKPRSHRIYIAPGAVFASFADPLDATMLVELRSWSGGSTWRMNASAGSGHRDLCAMLSPPYYCARWRPTAPRSIKDGG